jgi:hypothetical protein
LPVRCCFFGQQFGTFRETHLDHHLVEKTCVISFCGAVAVGQTGRGPSEVRFL